jgi:hypothetical protein
MQTKFRNFKEKLDRIVGIESQVEQESGRPLQFVYYTQADFYGKETTNAQGEKYIAARISGSFRILALNVEQQQGQWKVTAVEGLQSDDLTKLLSVTAD